MRKPPIFFIWLIAVIWLSFSQIGLAGAYLAAEYIRNQHKGRGIPPAPSINDYFQKITMHGSMPIVQLEFKVHSANVTFNVIHR